MANRDNLAQISNGASFGGRTYKAFQYVTADTVATVTADGYFDNLAEYFTEGAGDTIFITAVAGGAGFCRMASVKRTGGDIELLLAP